MIKLSVFTKPWKTISVAELGEKMSGLGVDGIEFPLRPGFQLEPQNAEKGLPILARQLADYGLRIYSVASELDERVFSGCALAGVPLIRTMPAIDPEVGYRASANRERERLARAIELCKTYKVKIGVQQHYGDYVPDSSGLLNLLEGFDPECVGAIWDAAHDGLAGQQPEYGLDILWPILAMVNLKNAYYARSNGPEAEQAEWERYFTTGRHGLSPWPRAIAYLNKRKYEGVVTLTAEYTAEDQVDRLIREDVEYVSKLLGK